MVSVTPNNGPLAGGANVTIVGAHYGDINQVQVAETPATILFQNESTLVVQTTAAAAPKTGAVVVTSPTIGACLPTTTYTYNPGTGRFLFVVIDERKLTQGGHWWMCVVGVLASIVPPEGPAAGGNTVTLTGTGLGSGTDITAVTFNGVVARIVSQTATVVVVSPAATVAGVTTVNIASVSRGVAQTPANLTYTYHPGTFAFVGFMCVGASDGG